VRQARATPDQRSGGTGVLEGVPHEWWNREQVVVRLANFDVGTFAASRAL
jgi:hypothetical protein